MTITDMFALLVMLGGCLFGLYLAVKGVIHLCRHRIASGLAYVLVGLPLFLLLVASLLLPAVTCDVGPRPRTGCMRNLSQIGMACIMYSMDHDEAFPTSFRHITNFLPDPGTFICPHSGHKPGPLGLVDEWTDYVLVTNLSAASSSDLILSYCQPKNHDGQGCNVLFVDGSTMWTNPEAFSNLSCEVESLSRLNTREPQPEN